MARCILSIPLSCPVLRQPPHTAVNRPRSAGFRSPTCRSTRQLGLTSVTLLRGFLNLHKDGTVFEDAHSAVRLRNGNSHRICNRRDACSGNMPTAETTRQLLIFECRVEMPSGGHDHAIVPDDEGSVESRELTDRLTEIGV